MSGDTGIAAAGSAAGTTGGAGCMSWPDACLAAALLAIDPHGLGGAVLFDQGDDGAAHWLSLLRRLLPPTDPIRRLPSHISDDRLLGGLDLAATLAAGRRVMARGLLAEADGGFVLASGASRLPASVIAHLAAGLDTGEAAIERDGFSARATARFGVIAIVDGGEDGLAPAASLADRLSFQIVLDGRSAAPSNPPCTAEDIVEARRIAGRIRIDDEVVDALCRAAARSGIDALRAPILTVRVARLIAALRCRDQVTDDDAAMAAGLVLGPRMMRLPEPADLPADKQPPPSTPPPQSGDPQLDQETSVTPSLEDLVLAAVGARLPAHLMDTLTGRVRPAPARGQGRRSMARQTDPSHGRPVGLRRARRRGGERLDVVATLRAAAPWQAVRRGPAAAPASPAAPLIAVRREDFHVKRLKRAPVTIAIFVVDASGSSALNRLAEAKGAVELMLADCYVRRDEVALIAFRGKAAELLLPPTRSLVRAKRSLAGLPGGGGTPLASGIEAAAALADSTGRKGRAPIVVLLTDGRANVGRDGSPGRARAEADAVAAAERMRLERITALLIDTSPRPEPRAARLAEAMAARYLALPFADARALAVAVKQVAGELGTSP